MKIKLFILTVSISFVSFGQILVDDIKKLPSLMKDAKPGDEFIISDGVFDEDLILQARGSAKDSITVRAQNIGYVIFDCKVVLSGEYLIFKGFRFRDSAKNTPDSIKLNSTINLENLKNSSIVKNQFIKAGRNAENTYDVIISVDNSNFLRIENNYFYSSRGNCIYVAPPSQNIFVKSNIFNITPRAEGNRWEMLKINYRIKNSEFETKVVVSNNLFLNYSGDDSEVISLKASGNFILDNLFYKCNGDVTFRQGTSNMVNGNIFYRSSGVRISGKNHTLSSNYFIKSIRSPITIMSGDGAKKNPVYEPTSNVTIINNYIEEFKNSAMIIGLGPEKCNVSPKDILISNNRFYVNNREVFVDWRKSDRFDFNFMNDIITDTSTIDINRILLEKNIFLPDNLKVDFR